LENRNDSLRGLTKTIRKFFKENEKEVTLNEIYNFIENIEKISIPIERIENTNSHWHIAVRRSVQAMLLNKEISRVKRSTYVKNTESLKNAK